MKPEDAIEIIKVAIAEVEWNYPMDYTVAFEEAIMALEKQVPKKPIKLTCPTCGFDKIDNSWWVFTYCPKCGQLLDWEGIE